MKSCWYFSSPWPLCLFEGTATFKAIGSSNALGKTRVPRNSYIGYTSEIMAKLRPQAAAAGYTPDCYVTSDLVPNARPSPAMIFKNMIDDAKLAIGHPIFRPQNVPGFTV